MHKGKASSNRALFISLLCRRRWSFRQSNVNDVSRGERPISQIDRKAQAFQWSPSPYLSNQRHCFDFIKVPKTQQSKFRIAIKPKVFSVRVAVNVYMAKCCRFRNTLLHGITHCLYRPKSANNTRMHCHDRHDTRVRHNTTQRNTTHLHLQQCQSITVKQ